MLKEAVRFLETTDLQVIVTVGRRVPDCCRIDNQQEELLLG